MAFCNAAVYCDREYGHPDDHRATIAGTPYVWRNRPGEGASCNDAVDLPLPEDPPAARAGNRGQYDQTSLYEPIKIIHHYDLNFDLGNVVKYVLRAGKKPGVDAVEDLEKARQYIDFEITRRRSRS